MQHMAQQLTDAGLPVPPEGNMDELYQSVVDKCLDEKNKASAVKAPKQAMPAGSPKGQPPSKLVCVSPLHACALI